MNQIIKKTKSLVAVGPYSLAREINNTLYLSGQIGIDSQMKLIPGGVEVEFKKIIQNTKELLKQAGYSFSDIIKVVIFLKDVKDFKAINQLYQQYFKKPYPVRTTVGVKEIPLNANIEVEITAIKQ